MAWDPADDPTSPFYRRSPPPQGAPSSSAVDWDPAPDREHASPDGFAVAAMLLGLLWIFAVGSALAVILGHVSVVRIRRRAERGMGYAITGLVLGYLGLVASAIATFEVGSLV